MKILQSEPNDNIANSQLFQFKVKITKNVETAVPLKYLSNLWRALELSFLLQLEQ